MKHLWFAFAACVATLSSVAQATSASPVTVEIIGPQGQVLRQFPVRERDRALRSYLQAEKGARYQVRVRNDSAERLGLVIAVDGRNIISGEKSDLERSEPMYVLDAWSSEGYAGWRANLESINEFYFTDWSDSYAEAFGDRSARGVIAVAVFREVPPAPRIQPRHDAEPMARDSAPAAAAARPAEKSAGTGYGDRRSDQARRVEFMAQPDADSRHFIKYEWHETLCRKRVIECVEKNRFWDESTLGFAPPPPRH